MAESMPANLLDLMRRQTPAWRVTFTSPAGSVVQLHNYQTTVDIQVQVNDGKAIQFDLAIENVNAGVEGFFSYWRGVDYPAEQNEWFKVLGSGTKVVIELGYETELVTCVTGYIVYARTRDAWDGYTILVHGEGTMGWLLGDSKIEDASLSRVGTYTGSIEGFVAQAAQWMGYVAGDIVTEPTGVENIEIDYDNDVARDKFQVLADNVGFRLKEGRTGKLHFVSIPNPDNATLVWTFSEGQDIQDVEYVQSVAEVYRELLVYARDASGNLLTSTYQFPSADQYNLPAKKRLVAEFVGDAVAITQSDLNEMTWRIGQLMASKVHTIIWSSLANPWLDLDDPVRVMSRRSTVSDKYILSGISLRLTEESFLARYTARHYEPLTNDVQIGSSTDTKVFQLGVEPAGWQTVGFDDSAWTDAVHQTGPANWADIALAEFVWATAGGLHTTEETALFRHSFTISASFTTGVIEINHDDSLEGLWVNGTFVAQENTPANPDGGNEAWFEQTRTYDVTAQLVVGTNVIAAKVHNIAGAGSYAMIQFALTVT